MTSSPENKITRSDLVKSAVSVGALGMEFSWTYYKQMNIAFCLMVANMLKKIYAGRPDDYAAALHRHCAFFNITVQFAPFVGGIAMAMEEKVARGEIEPESVNDVKAALMGPLSGIGDSIFLSTLRVVAAAVGISLCQAGNPFGPIAFLLIYNVPGFALRIWGAVKGYELGVGFLDEAQRTGLMQKIMTCVGIVGVMVVGAMCKDMFWASIPVAIGSGDDAQTLQDILDGIMRADGVVEIFNRRFQCLDKGFAPNEPVDVVIRPEDIDIVPVEQGQLVGTVTNVTFKGMQYDIIVDFRGFKWLIQTTDHSPVGARIGVKIDPDGFHIMKKSEYSGQFGDYSSYSEEYEELADASWETDEEESGDEE